MKRRKKALGYGALAVLVAAILALSIDITVGSFTGGVESRYGGFLYKGDQYSEQYFRYRGIEKRLGSIEYGSCRKVEFHLLKLFDVYAIKDDSNHDFLHVNLGLDTAYSYVRDGVKIPTFGTVTEVFNDFRHSPYNHSTKDAREIEMFQRIAGLTGELKEFTTDDLIFSQREFYFAYDNWPVAAHTPGSIVYTEGNFFFVKDGDSQHRPDVEGQYTRAGFGKGIVIADPELLRFIKENPIHILPASYHSE